MKWHLDFSQHTKQFGFALTVSFIDPRELEGTEMEGSFACSECGIDTPTVHLEVTLLVWTLMLISHAEETE